MSKKGVKSFGIPPVPEVGTSIIESINPEDSLTVEGVEGEILSETPENELKERAEFEESTGLAHDTNQPILMRRDEICATFGASITTYIDPELLTETGSTNNINSINVGKFLTGEKGFKSRKAGFYGYLGRGFLGGVGVGFDYSPTEGFGTNFMTGNKGFYPIGFDTATDPNQLLAPTICIFPIT